MAANGTSHLPAIEEHEEVHAQADPASPENERDEDITDLGLEPFDWDELHTRYQVMLETCGDKERELWAEFQQLLEFFACWSKTSQEHDEKRLLKRIGTRVAHVQHSEGEVDGKRQHYERVVQAFQSALQLLNSR